MIQVKSFKISDSDGINKLLNKYRLASGAHILVSEGQICVPYEDGLEANSDQIIAECSEQRNTLSGQLRIIEHSQDVVVEQIKAQEQVFEETKAKYEANSSNKLLGEEHKRRKEILTESKRLFQQNQAEEARLRLNVELFNKKIEKLKE